MSLPPYQYNPNEIGFGVGFSNSVQYGGAGNVNRQFFNDRGTNWKDSTKFAYEQLAQREANAFNVAMMNYQNEYNSPLEQMKRYQAAGINPYQQGAIQSVQSQSPAGSGAARGSASAVQESVMKIQAASSLVNGISNILDSTLSAKKDLIELKSLPMLTQSKAWNESFKSGLLSYNTEIAKTQSLLQGLTVLRTLYDYGIDLPHEVLWGNPKTGDAGLLQGIFRSAGEGYEVDPTSIYADLQQALLDLREEQKNTQTSTQSKNAAQEDLAGAQAAEARRRTSLGGLTGIPVLDKILNKLLD